MLRVNSDFHIFIQTLNQKISYICTYILTRILYGTFYHIDPDYDGTVAQKKSIHRVLLIEMCYFYIIIYFLFIKYKSNFSV